MRRTHLAAIAVTLGLVLGACGGDDDTETASEDTTAEESEPTTTEATDEEGTGDGLSEDEQDALAEGLGECGFLARFASAFGELDPTTFASGEAVDFGNLFGPMAEAAEEVAADAPDEIREAFETLAEGFATVADELEGVVVDLSDPANIDPEALAAFEGIDATLGPDFEAAGTEIEAWVADTCPDFADTLDLDGLGG